VYCYIQGLQLNNGLNRLRHWYSVYFIGFTKDKKEGPKHYMCKAVVIESPSPFNKAPHRVQITAVGLSRFHKEGTEEDGKTLIGKTIYLPIEKLNAELQDWLAPEIWWV